MTKKKPIECHEAIVAFYGTTTADERERYWDTERFRALNSNTFNALPSHPGNWARSAEPTIQIRDADKYTLIDALMERNDETGLRAALYPVSKREVMITLPCL